MSEQEKKWTLDALAALSNAIADSKHIMKSSPIAGLDVLEMLIAQGYHLRRETMTEAELEKAMKDAISDKRGYYIAAELERVMNVAKKYRG